MSLQYLVLFRAGIEDFCKVPDPFLWGDWVDFVFFVELIEFGV